MNQASDPSSSRSQWAEYTDVDDEEPDPCPEKYRDPLWEEFFKDDESATRSTKGKEKLESVNQGYYQSQSWPIRDSGEPYNVSFERLTIKNATNINCKDCKRIRSRLLWRFSFIWVSVS